MMKGIDAEHAVTRLACPRQTINGSLHESGSGRLDSRTGQHARRYVRTHGANPGALERSKPMARTAANFECPPVGMLTDEGHQRRLDARVVVLLVPPVVCVGDVVVIYGSTERVHGGF